MCGDSFKVAMRLAYNGGAFYGFQSQKDEKSVVATLLEVLRSVGIFSKITGSGRTDKGVHSSAQVISLEIPMFWQDLEKLQQQLNAKLYPNIIIKRIWRVGDTFHARFHATRRGYCYILSKNNSPFLNPFALYYPLQNPKRVKAALKMLVGEHNFKAFMKKGGCGDNGELCDSKQGVNATTRMIYRAQLREFEKFWVISFWGNGFLRSQVRLMVGFLLEIDKGYLALADLESQLKGAMLYRIPVVPNGLYLTRVDY